jgi:DNA-binding MarR family transcriptional regulator
MRRENMTASELFRDNFATVDGFMSFFRYKTVRELASESGLETKDVSKVIKKMLQDGDAIKRGRAYKYPNGR